MLHNNTTSLNDLMISAVLITVFYGVVCAWQRKAIRDRDKRHDGRYPKVN